jgi:hypothetical protein
MWNLVLVCSVIVLVSMEDRSMVCADGIVGLDWMHPMVLLADEAQVEVILVRLEIVLILKQDRCTVCAERTIGSKIILDAPDGTPR